MTIPSGSMTPPPHDASASRRIQSPTFPTTPVNTQGYKVLDPTKDKEHGSIAKAIKAYEKALTLTGKNGKEALNALAKNGASIEQQFANWRINTEVLNLIHDLPPDFPEDQLEAFLQINREFPKEAAFFLNRKKSSIKDFQLNGRFFLEVAEGLKHPEQREYFANFLKNSVYLVSNPIAVDLPVDQYKFFLQMPPVVVQSFQQWSVGKTPHEIKNCFSAIMSFCGSMDKFPHLQNLIEKKNLFACMENLIGRFPQHYAKMIFLLKKDPELLIALEKFNKNVDAKTLDHIVHHHINNQKIFTAPFLDQLFSDKEKMEKFLKLMNIEMEQKISLFHLFGSDTNRLNSELFEIIKDGTNAKQIAIICHGSTWEDDSAFKLLCRRIKQKDIFLTVLNLKSLNNVVFYKFIFDESLWDKKIPHSQTAAIFHTIKILNANPANTHYVPTMLILLETGNFDLATRFSRLKDHDLMARLNDVIQCGGMNVAKKLLNIPETEILAILLRKKINVDTYPIVDAILNVKDARIMELALKQSKTQEGFTPEFLAVLKLEAQGETELLNKAIEYLNPKIQKPLTSRQEYLKELFISLLEAGNFALAQEMLNSERLSKEDPFISQIFLLPNPVAETLQALRDFHLSLKNMNLESTKIAHMEFFAMHLLAVKPNNDFAAQSWIGKAQFMLTNDPDAFLKLVSATDLQADEKELNEFFDKFDKAFNAVFQKKMKGINIQDKQSITTTFADCLVTRIGTINTELIAHISKSDAFRNLSLEDSEHIDHVLTTFIKHQSLSDRLEKYQGPASDKEKDVIKHAVKKTNIERRDGQVAIISALLWRLRQGPAGTCFGTSVMLRQDSTAEGIKVALEDYISILEKGFIRRKNDQNASVPYTYPEEILADHLLVRCRENIVISMVGNSHAMVATAKNKWHHLFLGQLKEFTDLKTFSSALAAIGHKATARYLLTARSNQNEEGGFLLVDENNNPFILSQQDLQQFLKKSILEEFGKLKFSDPVKEKNKTEIQAKLIAYVESANFYKEFFDGKNMQFSADISQIEPSLLANFWGTHIPVISCYNETSFVRSRSLPPAEDFFESILLFVEQLPESVKKKAEQSPQMLMEATMTGHAMNLRIGALVPLLKKSSPAKIAGELRQKNKALMELRVNPAIMKEMMEKFIINIKSELHEVYKKHIEMLIKNNPPSTLQDLCRIYQLAFISTRDHDEIRYARTLLIATLKSMDSIQKYLPLTYSCFDINESPHSRYDFGLNVFDARAEPYVSNDGKPVLTNSKLPTIESCQVYEHGDNNDDYRMPYAT